MKSHRSPLETIRAFCVSCVGGYRMERLTDACTCRFEERSC